MNELIKDQYIKTISNKNLVTSIGRNLHLNRMISDWITILRIGYWALWSKKTIWRTLNLARYRVKPQPILPWSTAKEIANNKPFKWWVECRREVRKSSSISIKMNKSSWRRDFDLRIYWKWRQTKYNQEVIRMIHQLLRIQMTKVILLINVILLYRKYIRLWMECRPCLRIEHKLIE